MITYNTAEICSKEVLAEVKSARIQVEPITVCEAEKLFEKVEGFETLSKKLPFFPLGLDGWKIFAVDAHFVPQKSRYLMMENEEEEDRYNLSPFDFLRFLQRYGLEELYSQQIQNVIMILPVDDVRQQDMEINLMIVYGPMLYGRMHGQHVYSIVAYNEGSQVYLHRTGMKWNQILPEAADGADENSTTEFESLLSSLRMCGPSDFTIGVSRQLHYALNEEGDFYLKKIIEELDHQQFRLDVQGDKQVRLETPNFRFEAITETPWGSFKIMRNRNSETTIHQRFMTELVEELGEFTTNVEDGTVKLG